MDKDRQKNDQIDRQYNKIDRRMIRQINHGQRYVDEQLDRQTIYIDRQKNDQIDEQQTKVDRRMIRWIDNRHRQIEEQLDRQTIDILDRRTIGQIGNRHRQIEGRLDRRIDWTAEVAVFRFNLRFSLQTRQRRRT